MSFAEFLEPLAASSGAHALAFVLGALFGSFANVCIYRLPPSDEHPRGQSVVVPGSHCFACGKPVKWYDNVPIVSYLWLAGKCRGCGAEFSPRYLFVEAATGLLFGAAYHYAVVLGFSGAPIALRLLCFASMAAFLLVLVIISFIDLDHQLILDKITYPAIPIFYALGLLVPGRSYLDGLVGAVVGYGVIFILAHGYALLTGREGMGMGDAKLLALIGAFLGWKGVVTALFVGSLVGSVIGVTAVLVSRRRARETPAPDARAAGGEAASAEAAGGAAEREEPARADAGDRPPVAPPPRVSLRHVGVPFGPFLAIGAIVYLFSEAWLSVALTRVYGPYPPAL